MRIAQVAPPWLAVPPKGYGGIEWVVSLLTDGLVERNHAVTLFATGDSTTRAHLEFLFQEAPGPGLINSIWHDTAHTLHALRSSSEFDVLHVHAPYSALAAASQLDVPVIHTVHGAFDEDMRLLYAQVPSTVRFVAISEAQRAHMPELSWSGVVYNGIDVPTYPFRERKEDFLLFLGRAAPEKGAHLAVLAAKEAGLRIVLAGKVANEEEHRHWENDVLPSLPSDAMVLGEIDVKTKMDLLARAKAVLFPIDWEEPFGLVMTEAMACGTPVVATPRGSVPEVVVDGQTGFVVPVEDYPTAAAKALKDLAQIDPRACRARVEERFSKDAMVAGYERVFAAALNGTAASRSRPTERP